MKLIWIVYTSNFGLKGDSGLESLWFCYKKTIEHKNVKFWKYVYSCLMYEFLNIFKLNILETKNRYKHPVLKRSSIADMRNLRNFYPPEINEPTKFFVCMNVAIARIRIKKLYKI